MLFIEKRGSFKFHVIIHTYTKATVTVTVGVTVSIRNQSATVSPYRFLAVLIGSGHSVSQPPDNALISHLSPTVLIHPFHDATRSIMRRF